MWYINPAILTKILQKGFIFFSFHKHRISPQMYIIGTIIFLGQHIPDHSMFRLYGATHTSTMEPQICNFIDCK